jgi:hypothetical protein
LIIAGNKIEPIATTVAGLEPEMAANRAQASAVPVADHRSGEIDHALCYPAVRKEVTGKNKKRDGHDLEFLYAGEQFQGHRFDRHRGHGEEECQHREAERNGNRHTGEHQREQQHKNDGGVHGRFSSREIP